PVRRPRGPRRPVPRRGCRGGRRDGRPQWRGQDDGAAHPDRPGPPAAGHRPRARCGSRHAGHDGGTTVRPRRRGRAGLTRPHGDRERADRRAAARCGASRPPGRERRRRAPPGPRRVGGRAGPHAVRRQRPAAGDRLRGGPRTVGAGARRADLRARPARRGARARAGPLPGRRRRRRAGLEPPPGRGGARGRPRRRRARRTGRRRARARARDGAAVLRAGARGGRGPVRERGVTGLGTALRVEALAWRRSTVQRIATPLVLVLLPLASVGTTALARSGAVDGAGAAKLADYAHGPLAVTHLTVAGQVLAVGLLMAAGFAYAAVFGQPLA